MSIVVDVVLLPTFGTLKVRGLLQAAEEYASHFPSAENGVLEETPHSVLKKASLVTCCHYTTI